jgi:hypothetical protein
VASTQLLSSYSTFSNIISYNFNISQKQHTKDLPPAAKSNQNPKNKIPEKFHQAGAAIQRPS